MYISTSPSSSSLLLISRSRLAARTSSFSPFSCLLLPPIRRHCHLPSLLFLRHLFAPALSPSPSLSALSAAATYLASELKPLLTQRIHRNLSSMASEHPFKNILTNLPKTGSGEFGKFYSLPALNDPRIDRLPYSIRILLESAIRNCDNFQVTKEDVEKIIDWENSSPKQIEIPFKPARFLLQDFTGVPAVVDLACMRDAIKNLGSDPKKINPLVPVDLVVDHSAKGDVARPENAVQANMELEFQRNKGDLLSQMGCFCFPKHACCSSLFWDCSPDKEL